MNIGEEITIKSESEEMNFVFHRHGENDYAVWITDDVTHHDFGCSTRGTLEEILTDIIKKPSA